MSGAFARWWSSIAFRQALIFGALVVFTMSVLLAVFYVQTVGVWQRRIDSQIDTTTQRLMDYHTRSGSTALGNHINSLLGDGSDSDTEVYALVAPDGHVVAGNLAVTREIATTALRILARGELGVEILSDRYEPQRVRVAEHPLAGLDRLQSGEERRADSLALQLVGQRCGRHRVQLGAQLVGEQNGARWLLG